jgi:uncharacterized membrane protein (Fun14 family)
MNKWKKEIIEIGNYTIDSIYLKTLLDGNEISLFDCIVYFDETSQKYVSTSLLQIYTSFSNKTVISLKKNLIKLNFISVIKVTGKGMIFKIEWENICNVIKTLSNETNIVSRLILSDKIRVEKGLKTLNQKNIETFLNTSFDVDYIKSNKDENVNVNDIKAIVEIKNKALKPLIKKKENNLVKQFNDIQIKLNTCSNLGDRNTLNNELNRVKLVAKQRQIKITFDKTTQTWN